jgi:hypothetical protein
MKPHTALVLIVGLVASCSARSSYSADEVNLVLLGFDEHDVVVRLRVPSGSEPLGVPATKHGEGVAIEFARSGSVDCTAKKNDDGEFQVVVPYDAKIDRIVYLRDGDKFVQLGGMHVP